MEEEKQQKNNVLTYWRPAALSETDKQWLAGVVPRQLLSNLYWKSEAWIPTISKSANLNLFYRSCPNLWREPFFGI